MALTIDDALTRLFVWELAALMGESHTEAIDSAIRERLEREKIRLRDRKGDEVADAAVAKAKSQAMLEFGRYTAALMGPGPSAVEYGDYLYDENGLPK